MAFSCSICQIDVSHSAISNAFAVLDDENERAAYDRYGADEGGTGVRQPFQRRGFDGEEISPEDLFNMFFGGGMGPGMRGGFHGGGFGPGVRVRHFNMGGNRRRRNNENEEPVN